MEVDLRRNDHPGRAELGTGQPYQLRTPLPVASSQIEGRRDRVPPDEEKRENYAYFEPTEHAPPDRARPYENDARERSASLHDTRLTIVVHGRLPHTYSLKRTTG